MNKKKKGWDCHERGKKKDGIPLNNTHIIEDKRKKREKE